MNTVQRLLQNKGTEVWSVEPNALVLDALKLMAEKDIGAVVVRSGEEVVGIFSERDYARKVVLQGKSSRDTPVSDVMTRRVYYVRPEETIEHCMAVMTNRRIRHLPVMNDGQMLGLISIGDVVKKIISEQEFMIEQLEHYITGS